MPSIGPIWAAAAVTAALSATSSGAAIAPGRYDLDKVTRSIDRALTFILEGDGDPGIVRQKLADLEARKRDLERALNQTDPTPKLEIHPNLGELYRRKVNDLETLLQDEDTKPQATDILRSLIQRIDISAGQTRGHAEVRIFGALASILDFALESTHAKATADGGLCRVLMVAGAGFEPAAFRL